MTNDELAETLRPVLDYVAAEIKTGWPPPIREPAPRTWPREFNREQIRNWLQDATGEGLSVDDPLPDTLAANAEALGMVPLELQLWIHDQPRHDWTAAALASWARRNGFARPAEPEQKA